MSRPLLEVADIFRYHRAAWRKANAGHVSLGQMKVMSAIERCRTPVAGRARSRAPAGAVLPRGVHATGGDRRHRLSEQGGDLRPAVQSLGRTTLTIAADPKHL